MKNSNVIPLNTPAYARVRDQIRQDIIDGHWAFGSHVQIVEMKERYGVSGMPIREALQQLQGEGVVRMLAHRGAVIPMVDAEAAGNLYDVRATIQAMLHGKAAERITPAEVVEIDAIQEQIEDRARADDLPGLLAHNNRFHIAINNVAKNPQAVALLNGIGCIALAMRRKYGFGGDRVGRLVSDHRALVQALRANDGQTAQALMFAHAIGAKHDLLARMAAFDAAEARERGKPSAG